MTTKRRTIASIVVACTLLAALLTTPWIQTTAVQAATDTVSYGAGAYASSNPIGGGDGYVSPHNYVNATHDYTVTTLSELKSAISSAISGQIIWIPDGVTITISTIENAGARKVLSKTVPDGVVLASSRGYNGQAGGKIKVTAKASGYMTGIWFGSNCVVSGLTFEGPTAFSGSNCAIRCEAEHLEIENCEIYNFAQGGIYFEPPYAGYSIAWNSPKRHWVHHCYIHGIQQYGMGYGVARTICRTGGGVGRPVGRAAERGQDRDDAHLAGTRRAHRAGYCGGCGSSDELAGRLGIGNPAPY